MSSNSKLIGLIDCNAFYVSCERVFNPKLNNRPVVVLSNNDGAVIARSHEAKAIGIPMSAPYFKIKSLIEEHNIAVLSSNYTLYGDLSRRIMTIIHNAVPTAEIYSIDEAFMDFTGIPDPVHLSQKLYDTILKGVGIPTSIGLASTKTLAKIASSLAKTSKTTVVHITETNVDTYLKTFPVNDIWGIGQKMAPKLKARGIFTALDLKKIDPRHVRQLFGVVGERIIRELNGIQCLEVSDHQDPKKSITVSRSFGRPVTEIEDMQEAVAYHIERLGEKLRQQKSQAQLLTISMQSSPFHVPFINRAELITLPSPTNDTIVLLGGEGRNVHFWPSV